MGESCPPLCDQAVEDWQVAASGAIRRNYLIIKKIKLLTPADTDKVQTYLPASGVTR